MSSNVDQTAAPAEPSQTGVVTPDAQTTGLAATSGNVNNMDSATTVSSFSALPEEIQQAFLQGIAMTIVQDMQDAEDRRKALDQEYEDDG